MTGTKISVCLGGHLYDQFKYLVFLLLSVIVSFLQVYEVEGWVHKGFYMGLHGQGCVA